MKNKIKVSVIVIGAAFSASIFFQSKPVAHAQTLTAGEKFKNIKVLNDMPANQLGKVMNIFAASLGVNCNFCHIGEDFAKDGKKEKDTAREMIKMTLALNKDYFKGRIEVSCNTCHAGHEHPQSSPNLNPNLSGDERPEQPAVKPTADQIVEKYLAALGGTDKLAKVTSRYLKAQRVEPDGKTAETEEVWFKSGKYLSQTSYDKYTIREIFDGKDAVKYNNSEVIELKPDEIEQIKREAELFSPANIKAIYPKMEFRLLDKINGRQVYIVNAATADGIRERLAFDVESGLLSRRTSSTPTVLGNFVYQVDYSYYRNFGGVKIATTVRYAVPNISWTRKILEVKTNLPIDDAKFTAAFGKQ